jgi:hypothetical protein
MAPFLFYRMKNIASIVFVLGIVSIGFSFGVSRPSGKLTQAFEALKVYNYFEAKDLFYKTMKKDTVPSSYGLSVIYGREDNPFFQLDSAYKYIVQAIRVAPTLDENDRMDYAALGVDSLALKSQMVHVDSSFYQLALEKNSVEQWNEFIEFHHCEPYLTQAIVKRNELAYAKALELNSSSSFEDFMNLYPQAEQFELANQNYQKRLFEEFVGTGDISAYRSFIAQYPESPYFDEAETKVYELSTASETVEAYMRFIEQNPDNANVGKAWRKIYALEINELSAKSIAAFTLKYPNYPYSEELQEEFKAAVTRFYPVVENELWGFVDEKGALRIPCSYQWVEPFSENLAAVGTEDEVVFINKMGTVVIRENLEDAYSFKSGYVVAMRDDKMGVLNRFGEWIVQPIYEDLGEFSEGFFYASIDGSYGFLDATGEVAIPFQFEDATDFYHGLAIVESDSGVGIINTLGTQVSNFEYDWIEPFKQSVEVVRCRMDDQFGLLDSLGRAVVPVEYDHIGDWSEGLALAESNGKYGFINTRGDTAIAFTYTYSTEAFKNSYFKNGYAKVYQSNKVGIIDTLGNKVFPAMFEDIGPFEGNLIPVSKAGKWGYADLEIDLAIPYKYMEAHPFVDSLAIVKKGAYYGAIDSLGNEVIPTKYGSLKRAGNLWLASDSTYGIINLKGDTIVPFEYQKAELIDGKVVRLYKTEDQFAYFDFIHQKFIWKPSDN